MVIIDYVEAHLGESSHSICTSADLLSRHSRSLTLLPRLKSFSYSHECVLPASLPHVAVADFVTPCATASCFSLNQLIFYSEEKHYITIVNRKPVLFAIEGTSKNK